MRCDLRGRTILVVEDEWFIAEYVADALRDAGATVAGPVPTVKDALAALARGARPDAATLNIRLRDGDSTSVARRLEELAVPFLFLSANQQDALPPEMRGSRLITKPFAAFQVVEAVDELLRAPAG